MMWSKHITGLVQFISAIISSHTTPQPIGEYAGTTSFLGSHFDGTVVFHDTDFMNKYFTDETFIPELLDFSVTGDFSLDCDSETYTFRDNQVYLTNIAQSSDCVYSALNDNGVTLESIVYNDDADKLTVSLKHGFIKVKMELDAV